MLIKSFNINDIKNSKSNFFLFYGSNEGYKDEVIYEAFIKGFKGEIIKYDQNQILENQENFFEICLNESLFDDQKIIYISRVSAKLFEIISQIICKNIQSKKIIFNSDVLDKKSKIRQLFEKEKNLICVPFYEDNNYSLQKVADDFFKKNHISMSSENINIIIENCSGDRKNLKNEMNKILNYSFTKKKITKEEIHKLTNSYEKESYFELVDSCLSKNKPAVQKIINNTSFNKSDSIIIIRSFLSRIKRLLELKKLFVKIGNIEGTISNFRPQIFWKEKEVVKKQIQAWPLDEVVYLKKLYIWK